MKFLIFFVLGLALLSASCAGTNKRLRKSSSSVSEQVVPKIEEKKLTETATPIKEVEEKLVNINDELPDPHRYFVIIGSFRNLDNAKKYQDQIFKDGFSSEIVKNEVGLFRISVMATDVIDVARDNIMRIRDIFPKYFDTWLLIQRK